MRATKTQYPAMPSGILAQMNKWPVLSREQEYALASRYRQTGDTRIADALHRANLRFVVKIAHEYRGYGADLDDLIQEGNLGLFVAIQKYDPTRGYRLISYAVWWIRAYIQSYVMRCWSLVKIGTTQVERRLFFKLRSTANRLRGLEQDGKSVPSSAIARELGVDEAQVCAVEQRLAGRDYSLDAPSMPEGHQTRRDELPESSPGPEQAYDRRERQERVRQYLREAMADLKERERYVLGERLMADEPQTLALLGKRLHVSRERVRQIQNNVIRKLRGRFEAAGVCASG